MEVIGSRDMQKMLIVCLSSLKIEFDMSLLNSAILGQSRQDA